MPSWICYAKITSYGHILLEDIKKPNDKLWKSRNKKIEVKILTCWKLKSTSPNFHTDSNMETIMTLTKGIENTLEISSNISQYEKTKEKLWPVGLLRLLTVYSIHTHTHTERETHTHVFVLPIHFLFFFSTLTWHVYAQVKHLPVHFLLGWCYAILTEDAITNKDLVSSFSFSFFFTSSIFTTIWQSDLKTFNAKDSSLIN